MHVLLSPGGCNTTVITDVTVPDFLPPSFTDVRRSDASVLSETATAAAGVDVRPCLACPLCANVLLAHFSVLTTHNCAG